MIHDADELKRRLSDFGTRIDLIKDQALFTKPPLDLDIRNRSEELSRRTVVGNFSYPNLAALESNLLPGIDQSDESARFVFLIIAVSSEYASFLNNEVGVPFVAHRMEVLDDWAASWTQIPESDRDLTAWSSEFAANVKRWAQEAVEFVIDFWRDSDSPI